MNAPPPLKHEIAGAIADIIRNVDTHARELDKRWGFGRLPMLVDIDLMERFIRQRKKYNLAVWECAGSLVPADLERVRTQAEALKRGYHALEQHAMAAGHRPYDELANPVPQWEIPVGDNKMLVVVQDMADVGRVQAARQARGQKNVSVWSLEEIGRIITNFPEIIGATKDMFPGAEFLSIDTEKQSAQLIDDAVHDVPFGGAV